MPEGRQVKIVSNVPHLCKFIPIQVCCHIMIKLSEMIITEMLREEDVKKLLPKTVEEFKTVMIDMELEWQFLSAFLAIHSSHLHIKCLKGGSEAMK